MFIQNGLRYLTLILNHYVVELVCIQTIYLCENVRIVLIITLGYII